ncbi:MAG: hypothetical protein E7156_00365 [Streptococcus gallolyticus]|uniref:Uncharacterized protein n=1 Tax=Streptococcus gallolyticus TaxID=315405 RepID=A0A928AAU7_9STRE|nr:hypothetical protein [Streptococcus gallolyticus]
MKLSKKIAIVAMLALTMFSLTGIPVGNQTIQSVLGVPKVEAAMILMSKTKETRGLKYRWRYVYDNTTNLTCEVRYSSWKWIWQ